MGEPTAMSSSRAMDAAFGAGLAIAQDGYKQWVEVTKKEHDAVKPGEKKLGVTFVAKRVEGGKFYVQLEYGT